MRRRRVIALGLGIALAGSGVARAQNAGRVYRLAALTSFPRDSPRFLALFDELRQQGFIDGSNLLVDPRGFSVAVERQDAVAATIVASGPDAIICSGLVLTRVMQQATQSIPILTVAGDFRVVARGDSLARPFGNTTGISTLATDLDIKRQEILMELLPGARRMAALVNPASEVPGHVQALQDVARGGRVDLVIHRVHAAAEIGPAIEEARAAGAEALNVLGTTLLVSNLATIITRCASARLPAIYSGAESATQGGLVAYGARQTSVHRQLARQLIRVLRGTRPADIPVEQPTRLELSINLPVARALGLTVPPALLARADEVIE